ncbi:right-handed parallel beta-helix repeat-containing protein [Tunicatimonas pelagia]|uniref:right-handed parallel beta-helix repeat-containing protein n=1 Tax=Tunicatimonas pelagia TaxID=931531 RepID=UPI00266685F9|nr:right-handed parallel beta-helix repeat-containing protein [Tunicatimonas pelagia]WKN41287.1 PKD domain-containing protein [Tunicatimonas pelagia]
MKISQYLKVGVLASTLATLISCTSEEIDPTPDTQPVTSEGCIETEGAFDTASGITFKVSCIQSGYSYEWSFGDGRTSTSTDVTHTYDTAGTYTVELKIINDQTNEVERTVSQNIAISQEIPLSSSDSFTHGGTITRDECWEEGTHTVSADVYLWGAKLCIKPGAIIKFAPGTELIASAHMEKEAQIMAEGTVEKPILFTSGAENPQAGDYVGLTLTDGSTATSVFNHCTFEYGGKNTRSDTDMKPKGGLVRMDGHNQASFQNCTFQYSATYGLYLDRSAFASFSDNHVHDVADYAVYLGADDVPSIGANNRFDSQGIEIWPTTVRQNTRWEKQTCPYVASSLVVGTGNASAPTFEIGPGVEIHFENHGMFSVGSERVGLSGKVVAQGTEAEPIVLTASEDSWRGVTFERGTSLTSSLQYCRIEKVKSSEGSELSGVVNIFDSEVSMEHCTISGEKSHSVYVDETGHFGKFANNELGNPQRYSIRMPIEKIPTIGEGNTFSGQKRVEVFGSYVTEDATWPGLAVPYYTDSWLRVGSDAGNTLTLSPGVTIEFGSSYGLEVGKTPSESKGTLVANGTAEKPIVLTTGKPDAKWGGVQFGTNTGANSILNHCEVKMATIPVYIEDVPLGGVPVLSNSLFSDASSYGIIIDNSSPTLRNNTFANNSSGDTKTK